MSPKKTTGNTFIKHILYIYIITYADVHVKYIIYMCMYMYMYMRDEEGRKKEASKVKKTKQLRQSNIEQHAQGSHFS